MELHLSPPLVLGNSLATELKRVMPHEMPHPDHIGDPNERWRWVALFFYYFPCTLFFVIHTIFVSFLPYEFSFASTWSICISTSELHPNWCQYYEEGTPNVCFDIFRDEHRKYHEKHKGHDSMHTWMVLILFFVLIVAQILLVQWRRIRPRSYNVPSLLHFPLASRLAVFLPAPRFSGEVHWVKAYLDMVDTRLKLKMY